MATETTWRPTRRSDIADAALSVLLGVIAGVSLHIGGDPAIAPADMADYNRPLGIAVVALTIAPLALRRRFPLTVLGLVTAAYVPFVLHGVPEGAVTPVAYFIALCTAGAYSDSRHRDLGRGLAVAVIGALVVEGILSRSDDYEGQVNLWLINAFAAAQNLFYLAAAWFLGDVDRTRRQRETTLVAQAEALRAAQADRARRAVVDERVRIARELHDVVAHHVSVMGVQAGAARRVLESRPEAVPELLGSIETSSRQAVGELQRMLGLLRADADRDGGDRDVPAGADPQPTIAQLDALVGQMNEAGLAVSATVEGGTEGLPAAVELSAYRIVQEALTNTLKHAGAGTAVRVDVHRRPRALEITVADDGRAGTAPGVLAPDGEGGRHGLVGMRERVVLLGGELKVGRVRSRGFEVRAWLPLPEGSRP